jgi:glycosyltransferase involved in cell wall biosynthesis
MRILALTRYSSRGPSSRIRFYQYILYLTDCGVKLEVVPLLDDNYVHRLYAGESPSIFSVVGAYARRIAKLMKSRSYDLLWIEKELFPWLPAWAERILAVSGVPYVVDYDDAVFHRYDMHANPIIRGWLGKSIDAVMHHASTVVVGNDYLAGYARRAGASRIEFLPSVVDINRYSIREKTAGTFRIGWIGSPITAPYLGMIRDALEWATQKLDMQLVLVGAGNRDPLPGLAKDILPWSEASEVADIQSFDAGIMPLPDGPFERGKCGFKLIQYMACGLPVIASPVGVNTHIIEQGKTGFLPSSSADWVQAFALLSRNVDMRNEMGKAGRMKVEQEYSLQMANPRLLEILKQAATRN